jgi:hypothetical protein
VVLAAQDGCSGFRVGGVRQLGAPRQGAVGVASAGHRRGDDDSDLALGQRGALEEDPAHVEELPEHIGSPAPCLGEVGDVAVLGHALVVVVLHLWTVWRLRQEPRTAGRHAAKFARAVVISTACFVNGFNAIGH